MRTLLTITAALAIAVIPNAVLAQNEGLFAPQSPSEVEDFYRQNGLPNPSTPINTRDTIDTSNDAPNFWVYGSQEVIYGRALSDIPLKAESSFDSETLTTVPNGVQVRLILSVEKEEGVIWTQVEFLTIEGQQLTGYVLHNYLETDFTLSR